MAPLDNLSPAGSSQYSSNTMYVGDGTWDSTRNSFLLPNLMGFNFETMQYNGMGNRFRDFAGYHSLIKGHGILAVMTFLFIVPAAILIARFYGRNPGWALRAHIYLQILTLGLSTVVFILGFIAVGPERSLTNPHHGIGLAIYVIILTQAIGGGWIYRREKGKARRKLPVKLVMHQWLGRTVALLGIIQVPLGLTLYGSPKYTFVLYALWMAFLVLLYFILSYRALPLLGGGGSHVGGTYSTTSGTVITEKKKRGWLGPLAAGAGIAALLARRRSKKKERERSRSRSRSRSRIGGSRRDSGSFIEEEKYSEHKEGGGMLSKLFKIGGVVGAGALAKSWYDRRQQKKEDAYSSVAPDTPSRRHGKHRRHDSISEDSLSVHRMEEGHRPGGILPGPGDPVLAAAAISAASRPAIPRPAKPARRHSFDSASYTYTDSLSSRASPSRRPASTHKVRNSLIAGVGLGWAAKKWRDRRKSKEAEAEDIRIEEERRRRHGTTPTPAKFTGDGSRPPRRRPRQDSLDSLSSIMQEDVHTIRPGTNIPPIPASLAGAAMAGALHPSQSNLPPPPPTDNVTHFPQAESGSEQYFSSGGAMHRRHSSRRRREGEEAAALAAAEAARLASSEQRRRSRSRDYDRPGTASGAGMGIGTTNTPPVSVKVKMHGDADRNVTLRRLTEEEAAAEREARRLGRDGRDGREGGSGRRRADSLSDLSASDTVESRRRFRRDRRDREDELAAEKLVGAGAPLSPPNPAFRRESRGKVTKDSGYYSGRPEGSAVAGGGVGGGGGGVAGSIGSHGTWSAMSPDSQGGSVDPAERRRRRRLERTRPGQSGTVDFT